MCSLFTPKSSKLHTKIVKLLSKYKNIKNIFSNETIEYLLNETIDFKEFKQVVTIFLYTNLYDIIEKKEIKKENKLVN